MHCDNYTPSSSSKLIAADDIDQSESTVGDYILHRMLVPFVMSVFGFLMMQAIRYLIRRKYGSFKEFFLR